MSTPQPGILPVGNTHAYFLVLSIPPASDLKEIAALLRQSQSVAAEIAELDHTAAVVLNVGIGSDFWDRLEPSARPAGLHPFKVTGTANLVAPSTGGDIFFHIASARHDLNFELANRLVEGLRPAGEILEEVHGFRYLDSRDLTGFIDGTENPKGDERHEVALVDDEDAAFAGGSYVATERYVHRLATWRTVPLSEQEGAIGRTKADSVELADDVKPRTAHIARVVIEENGEELQILRHSYPYGTVREAGLFFVAYGKTLDNFEKMLAHMYGVSDDGLHDHLMEFSVPVSGATFFVPSMEVLARLGSV